MTPAEIEARDAPTYSPDSLGSGLACSGEVERLRTVLQEKG
jgi:hypothetical protein